MNRSRQSFKRSSPACARATDIVRADDCFVHGGEPDRLMRLRYPLGVDANDTVVLKVVSGEAEAEIVCGLLRSAGLECGYRDTEAIDGPFEDLTASGPREVLVLKSDLEAAQAVLAGAEG
jgi:hypothetical protein